MTTPPRDDSNLRRLLDDAVSDVHPAEGLDGIRARSRRPSARRWVPLTLAAAVATILVIGGAAWLAQRQPSSGSPAAAPGQTDGTSASSGASQPPSSQQPGDAGRLVETTVYYVGETASGPRLFPERRRVTGATGSDLQVALDEVLGGTPDDPDYQNPFRALGVTATPSLDAGAVTVDLSGPVARPSGMDDAAAQAAVQSLVWTADAAAQGSAAVTFTVQGAPVARVLGVDTSSPVVRSSSDSILSPVLIDSPVQGATVSTRFTVEGRAGTFEANVVWELKRGDTTVRHGFTTAQECCTLSPYSFTVTAPPGDYTLVVHDTDESDGEGVGTSQDTRDITVE